MNFVFRFVLKSILFLSCCIQAFTCQAKTFTTETNAYYQNLNHLSDKLAPKIFQTTEKNKNVIFSPYSLHMALMMCYIGAEQETKEDLQKLLLRGESEKSDIDSILPDYKKTTKNIEIHNSIWIENKYTLEKNYLKELKKYFFVIAQNFAIQTPEKSLTKINAWITDKTKGRIKNLLEKLDPNTALVLINTIFFKDTWDFQIDKKQTTNRVFYTDTTANSGHTEVATMSFKGQFTYINDENLQSVLLPYKGKNSLIIIMPKNENINKTLSTTITNEYQKLLLINKRQEAKIFLPKFKFDTKIEFDRIIKELGYTIPFDQAKANFSKINKKNNLYISSIIQNATVETDEEGTVAAAATAVTLGIKSMMPLKKEFETLDFNRPFYFVIIDELQNPLFIGKISSL